MHNIRAFGGQSPQLDKHSFVDDSAVIIGDVHLGAHSSIWPLCLARGDINRIHIGDYTNIQDCSVLHVTHDSEFSPGGQALSIGNKVTVGHRVILHACEIGDLCLVGMGAIIMDGAVMQSGSMLGAGSVVTGGKVLESGYLWLGAPARRVRRLTDKEIAFLDYSASHYAELAEKHKQSQVNA